MAGETQTLRQGEEHSTTAAHWRRMVWLTVSLQGLLALMAIVLGFSPFPELMVTVGYNLAIGGVVYLAFLHSVSVMRAQKTAQRLEPSSPGPIGPWPVLGAVSVGVVALCFLGAAAHIHAFWHHTLSDESIIEGLNYSVQTVTTVGYGNWVPDRLQATFPQMLYMKRFSVYLMLAGATMYTLAIGMLVNWLGTL
jgi:hypothetical protein